MNTNFKENKLLLGQELVVELNTPATDPPLRLHNRIGKRMLDVTVATLGLLIFGWLIVLAYFLATVDTRQNGLFRQTRIGQHGKPFRIIKIRTMRNLPQINTSVTTTNDPRLTRLGRFLRWTKIDELPQLLNVLLGQMSLVGPRPDVPGFADQLTGRDRIILAVRPGITGPATLVFRNEEALLAQQADPESYNRTVIYPEKVRLNREYLEHYRIWDDVRYLVKTILNSSTAKTLTWPQKHKIHKSS